MSAADAGEPAAMSVSGRNVRIATLWRTCLVGVLAVSSCTAAEGAPVYPLDGCDRAGLTELEAGLLYPFQSTAPLPALDGDSLYRLDDDGVLMYDYGTDYGGLGWAYNPFFIARHAMQLAVYRSQDPAFSPELERQLRAQLDWLVRNAVWRDEPVLHAVWPYPFPVDRFSMPAGWVSGLAQGKIAVALQYGFATYGDEDHCDTALGALAALALEIGEGGVAVRLGDDALWFEEYAHPDAAPPYVLNGHVDVLAALSVLRSEDAGKLLEKGIAGVRELLPEFDTGFLSRYAAAAAVLAPAKGYNVMHSHQLSWLHELTADPFFALYAMQFLDYANAGGYATATTSIDPVLHGPDRLDLTLANAYWSSPLPTVLTWHLDEPRVTDGIYVVGYFLKPDALPRALEVEVERPDGTRVSVAKLTDNEEPWFGVRWAPQPTSRIHVTITESNGWTATALFGARASYADERTRFLASYGAVQNRNLVSRMATSEGWPVPVSDGWVLIRPAAVGGILEVMPCPASLVLEWHAGAALDHLEPTPVAGERSPEKCQFEAPAGQWVKFAFTGAASAPVFRWQEDGR